MAVSVDCDGRPFFWMMTRAVEWSAEFAENSGESFEARACERARPLPWPCALTVRGARGMRETITRLTIWTEDVIRRNIFFFPSGRLQRLG
jgi:hypothetical protein